MITDARAEAACEFIRDHAQQMGELSGKVKTAEHMIKVMRAVAFSEAEGTVAEREAIGYKTPEVRGIIEQYRNDVAELETLRTRIKAAEMTFEVWRTQQANMRKGA